VALAFDAAAGPDEEQVRLGDRQIGAEAVLIEALAARARPAPPAMAKT
jgi:hypothetical protein